MSADDQKRRSAEGALAYIEDGMKLGLGTGSTAEHLVRLLGEKVKAGFNILCVPTSERTAALAAELGIPLSNLNETPALDLTIDGADEFDAALRLVKGGGGALLREKIVAAASKRMIVITDASKKVETLGAFPLPVEVIPFGCQTTAAKIEAVAASLGCTGRISRREDQYGEPFLTDSENFIYDCAFGRIPDADELAKALNLIPGVVDNGLFIGIADLAIIGTDEGIQLVSRDNGESPR
ncbi:MAG: ribose-5-phosphate isomerase RpiA [Alphaproteobacteria bacterium]|nr:ribose 5-phosphate isomerase A [Rhodobiaceae bacterium]MBO6541812.1 ribose-5-phosphate isomerase RpiA [Alphaproteobacteria bacterium]MBO6628702.1 ribose-5-phosphate isomerase RpiA [Alphaproteobacteria bacterium]MDF1627965.1 ribose-5-phosphate isomerase RpiA [Parvibaculaceae bacterium]